MAFSDDRANQATKLDAIGGRYDPVLLGLSLLLAAFGVVMVASSSIAIAEGLEVGPFYFVTRHVLFLLLGMGLAFAVMRTELKLIEKYNHVLLLGCFLLLLAVFLPGIGHSVNGAQRWINLGVSKFQAVEAVKVLLIIWMASYVVRYRDEIGQKWSTLLKPLGIAGLIVAFLLVQPDFGSAALILAITGGMVWLGGARIQHLLAIAALALPALAAIAVAAPYRVARLKSFLNPWADPFDDGFQLTQALIAIGRGEWFGVGLGGSVQKLFYLPEAHTDFIFSVTAEELGFVGSVGIIAVFALFSWRTFRLGLRAVEMRRYFAGFCAFGVGLWISLQAFVSIGVNLGLLPTKGLTLPLVSSGGSSVLGTCVAIGLLLRVSYELDRAERQVARLRGTGAAMPDVEGRDEPLPPQSPAAVAPVAAGPRGSRQRIEPKIGAVA
ncbi:putative lipid II flippase FtsW [Stenotrophomonas sp.]|uniref:putative lipid II flippase FtsW n=1 Tax=Stenotrophomonas sp. TaxID=69392 RepID=UPI0025F448C9|nr:putative lipid II flippase FtsW [Stenotrophomonas sp.]MBW8310804.1 putative lipid II flippase FtsW [Rhizobium sp.]MBW8376077.1 putative lipid II flippase FtsW [Stenotrophomonas sp.]